MKKDKNISKEMYIWVAIVIISIILFTAIVWFNYILTTPTTWIPMMNYEDFLVKYYTTQNNWLNFGIYIVTIILAVMGIVFAIDNKTKKEELEKLVNDKIADMINKYNHLSQVSFKQIDYSKCMDLCIGSSGTEYMAPSNGFYVFQGLYELRIYNKIKDNEYCLLYSFKTGDVAPVYVQEKQCIKIEYKRMDDCNLCFFPEKE